ncbi:hypothetical protein F5Y16DRAFT_162017 [Xylariaceae sp. FL0255]|nr:hypothetical protein F5Y16DRAFT_162017 [Xylariaceae sp. FL0255]
MAVLEITQIPLNSDPELLKKAENTVIPKLARIADEGAPVRNASIGSVVSENGETLRDENRTFLLVQWPSLSDFQGFLGAPSPSFIEFQTLMKEEKLAAGEVVVKRFEVDDGEVSKFLGCEGGPGAMVEFTSIRPKSSDNDAANVLNIVRRDLGTLFRGASAVAVGESQGADLKKEIAALGIFGCKAELERAQALPARQELLESIISVADLSSVVARLEKRLI